MTYRLTGAEGLAFLTLLQKDAKLHQSIDKKTKQYSYTAAVSEKFHQLKSNLVSI